jgi:hypothetical protein
LEHKHYLNEDRITALVTEGIPNEVTPKPKTLDYEMSLPPLLFPFVVNSEDHFEEIKSSKADYVKEIREVNEDKKKENKKEEEK